MKRNPLSLLLAFGLVLSLLAGTALAAPAPTFTDVVEGAWYEQDVAYVYEHSLMDGTGGGVFSPAGTTTRAALVTILYRMEGEPAASGTGGFADVAGTAWYAPPVAWAAANHIVTGTTDTTFSPNQPITREQMAVILCRYAQAKGWDTSASADLSAYRDQGSISAYARQAMAWANGTGLIGGTTSTTLSPQSTATRAQAAAILHRFCQEVSPVPPPASGETFVPAADTDWKSAYRAYIQEDLIATSGGGSTADLRKEARYYLFDGNGDQIPELWMNYVFTYAGQRLCTYDGSQVREVKITAGGLEYQPGQNSFLVSGGRMDVYYDKVYRIENGGFRLVAQGESVTDYQGSTGGSVVYDYTWNGSAVSQAGYQRALASAFDKTRSVTIWDQKSFTYTEIMQMLAQ